MENETIPGLLLAVSMWGATASAAQSAITCDRECLRGFRQDILDERDGLAGADVVGRKAERRCCRWYA